MPATFDLSLDELKQYTGTGSSPVNFDSFWDHNLHQLSGFTPKCDWTPAAFQSPVADCFDLRFESFDGSSIYVKALLPKAIKGPVPALIRFHGYGACSEAWTESLSPYTWPSKSKVKAC